MQKEGCFEKFWEHYEVWAKAPYWDTVHFDENGMVDFREEVEGGDFFRWKLWRKSDGKCLLDTTCKSELMQLVEKLSKKI
jgi:hypothetical protein